MIPKKPNIKERETKTVNKTKRSHIIVPLVVMLMLICVIATIYIIGAGFGRKAEIAGLNKDIEKQEEKISAATDIAETSIGTNVKATFTASTGEIEIKNEGNISKSSWNSFLNKIIKEDGNLNAVKTITFRHNVYAPKDSSNLFNPIISGGNFPFYQLVTINNLDKLKTDNVTDMTRMFENCSSLTSIDINGWNLDNVKSMKYMFANCRSLSSFNLKTGNVTDCDVAYMFVNCKGLLKVDLKPTGMHFSYAQGMFEACSALEEVNIARCGTLNMAAMFQDCISLNKIKWSSWFGDTYEDVINMCGMFWRCTSLTDVDLSGVIGSLWWRWTNGTGGPDTHSFFGVKNLRRIVFPERVKIDADYMEAGKYIIRDANYWFLENTRCYRCYRLWGSLPVGRWVHECGFQC